MEKALKAYLIKAGKTAWRVHDLTALLEECITLDRGFEQLRDECATLTPYYTTTRYPDAAQFVEFTEHIAQEAYEFAEKIVTFVQEKLQI